MKVRDHLRRFVSAMKQVDNVKLTITQKSIVAWRRRRLLAAYRRQWAAQSPHDRLAIYIDILNRHPDLRKAMREALGVKAEKRVEIASPYDLNAHRDRRLQ